MTACSNAPPGTKIFVDQAPYEQVHPELPQPVTLNTIRYEACGDKLCVTVIEARREARNKAEVGRWMDRVNNIVRYYRGESENPDFQRNK